MALSDSMQPSRITGTDKALSASSQSGMRASDNNSEFIVHCFSRVCDVSKDWPAAMHNAPGKLHSNASPNYHIFQTTSFLHIWAETYAPALKAELCLIEVRTVAGQPVVFLPLALISRNGIRLLSFTDHGVSDYNAPVIFDCGIEWTRSQAENLWQQITRALPDFDYANFENMPEKLGSLINPFFLLANSSNPADSHATSLTPDRQTILQGLKQIKSIRRKIRRLEDIGTLTFTQVEDQEERQAFLDFMLQEKQQRFIETEVPGFETTPEKLHYFRRATEVFHEAGVLHLAALKIDHEIIAGMWGLTSGPHYYGIMVSANLKKWGKYSPGNVLYCQLIEQLKQQNYDCLDMGVGNEDWKIDNCDLIIPLMRMTICATRRGKLYETRMNCMSYLRASALWQALRPLKWRIIRFFKS